MKKNSILVKTVLMSMLTAGSVFSFTSCADDLEIDKAPVNPETEQTAKTRIVDEDEFYNINNDPNVAGFTIPFDKTNWWQHTHIIARVSSGINENIKDKHNRTGYQSLVLPWAKNSKGEKRSSLSKLPNGFFDGFTPENGWSLVANYCGHYDFVNGNYIVFYNKYTGILRYFYYIPQDADLNKASDHNWEILMGNGTAEHAVFGYALPNDRNLDASKFEKAELKAYNGNYWSQITTPYGITGDKFGGMQPQQGWYAFDVDLSVYRGFGEDGKTSMAKDQVIIPVLRGYNKSNVDLFGKITADIKGSIDMKKCAVKSDGGIFGPLEDVLGQVNDIKGFIGDAAKVYKDVMSGNVLEAIEGGISVAKKGCDIAGIDYGEEKSGFDGYKGTANLKLDGTMNLAGEITESSVIQGAPSIEQSINTFDFSDTHLGEGVWNLAETPVVYFTNAQVQYRNEYMKRYEEDEHDYKYEYVLYGNFAKGPFGAQKEEWTQKGKNIRKFANTPSKPWCGYINYFDPSSIKVVLNPNLFTKEDIDSAKVYATCGVRKSKSAFGSVDAYRAAFGLEKSKQDIDMNGGRRIVNRAYSEAPFNALSSSKEKHGMKTNTTFAATPYDSHSCGMVGCGDKDYILMPQPLSGDDHPFCTYMPSYEVTVTVIVKHEGKTFVYSRAYLPRYEFKSVANMPAPTPAKEYDKIRPANYVPAVFAEQMNHYRDVYNWTRRTLQPCEEQIMAHRTTGFGGGDWEHDDPDYTFSNLFDGYYSSKWRQRRDHRVRGLEGNMVWMAECEAYTGVSPTGYILTTAKNGHEDSYAPRIWKVYGSNHPHNLLECWTLLDSRSTAVAGGRPNADALPNKEMTSKKYTFNKGKADNYQYYRIEISQSWHEDDDTFMQLGEFELTYDD